MSHNLPESTAVTFVQENPKKAGGKSYDRYALYKSGTTIEGALALGMLKGDVANDLANGYLKCVDEAVGNAAVASLKAEDNLKKFKPDALVRIKALAPNPVVVGGWQRAPAGAASDTDPKHFGFVVKVLNVNQESPHESRVSIRIASITADPPVIQEFSISELALVTLSEYKEMRFSLACSRCNQASVAGKVMCQCYGKQCLSCIHVRCLGPREPLDKRGHQCGYCRANGFEKPGPKRPQDQQAVQPAPGQDAIRPERERHLEMMVQLQQMQGAPMGHPMPAPQMQGVPPRNVWQPAPIEWQPMVQPAPLAANMPHGQHPAPDAAEMQQRLLAEQERRAEEELQRMVRRIASSFNACIQMGIHNKVYKDVTRHMEQELNKKYMEDAARRREEEREVAPPAQALHFGGGHGMPAPVAFGGQPAPGFAVPPPQPGFNFQGPAMGHQGPVPPHQHPAFLAAGFLPGAAPRVGAGVVLQPEGPLAPDPAVAPELGGPSMFANIPVVPQAAPPREHGMFGAGARDADGQPPHKKAMYIFGSSGSPSGSLFGPGLRLGDPSSSASSAAQQHLVPNAAAALAAPAQAAVKAEDPALSPVPVSQASSPFCEQAGGDDGLPDSAEAARDEEAAENAAASIEDNVSPKAGTADLEQGVRDAILQAPVPRE